MAGMNDEKLRMMEDEMNRFEAEIALPVLPPPPPPPPPPQPPVTTVQAQRAVIGANTYNQVQRRLEEQQMVPAVPDYQTDPSLAFAPLIQPVAPYAGIPPPPPPPPLPPPPPPPPPMLVPHQVQRGHPVRHPVMRPAMAPPTGPPVMPGPPPPPPAPPNFMPPAFMPMPGPPMMDASMVAPITTVEAPIATMQTPVPAIVSATPLIYSAKTPGDAEDSAAAVPADGDGSADDLGGQKRKKLKTDHTEVHVQTPQQRAKEMSDRVRASTVVTVGPTVPGQTTADDSNTTSRKKEKKPKKHVRMAGGQVWEDSSLAEWEEDDFRIFCGDLGNDVTDEILTRAFSKYQSFMKAKVIRDKRSNKTKGFGFVSFKDPQDFIKAMKEMNGRYVGSRPIKLRKSTWRARNIETVKKKEREKTALIGLLTGR